MWQCRAKMYSVVFYSKMKPVLRPLNQPEPRNGLKRLNGLTELSAEKLRDSFVGLFFSLRVEVDGSCFFFLITNELHIGLSLIHITGLFVSIIYFLSHFSFYGSSLRHL
jgi:hypothetical protein